MYICLLLGISLVFMSSSKYCCISYLISGIRAKMRMATRIMKLGARWIGFARRNQVKINFWKNYGPQSWALLSAESISTNDKNYGPQLLTFEARIWILRAVSRRNQKGNGPLRPGHLSTLCKTYPKQKEKENTIGEDIEEEELKNRTRNRRSS
jgi:hypothetical protein